MLGGGGAKQLDPRALGLSSRGFHFSGGGGDKQVVLNPSLEVCSECRGGGHALLGCRAAAEGQLGWASRAE